jgi:hypothetical protein
MKEVARAMDIPIDLLTDKHELLAFDPDRPDWWQWLEFEHGDRTYRVRVPIAYDGGVERIVRADDCGDRLYLTGEVGHDLDDRGRLGCLIVARPLEDGASLTIVFHSLYPLSMSGLTPGGTGRSPEGRA